MNNLQERKQKIAHFYDIESESERDALIAEIVKYAEGQNAEQFALEVRATFEQVSLSGIGIVYEALSKNPEKWSNFFLEEFRRAFQSAEKAQSPFDILDALEETCFVDGSKLPSRDDIIALLSDYLTNQNPIIRFKAILLLGDWIKKDNKSKHSKTIHKLTNRLEDSHWKVRHAAKIALEEWSRLPKGYRMGLMDRLRVHFLNPYQWE